MSNAAQTADVNQIDPPPKTDNQEEEEDEEEDPLKKYVQPFMFYCKPE